MNDPQLAAALRSRSPEALPELLDAYGDRLFSYCWCLLRNRENAQIAVRDALVVATAQIGRLVGDEWLGSWLYSLARAECLRREAVPAADADEPAARPHQDDADMRLMAWKAVTSMPADEAEALELDSRHHVDLRLVRGLPAAEADALLDRARRDLERAVGAEITIRKNHACPDRAAVMSGWTGSSTPAAQDRVLQHAATCSVCGPNLPRSVSPARVFALLPAPALSSVARLEILEFFDDPGKSAYREFAVSRACDAAGSWFLPTPEPAPPAGRRRLRVSRIGLAAAAAVAVTAVFALVGFQMTPSSITGHSPSAAATPGSASGAAQPGGGADAALPVKVKRQAGASPAAGSFQHSAATRTESLAVAEGPGKSDTVAEGPGKSDTVAEGPGKSDTVAASQPGTSSPSRPGGRGGPKIPPSSPSSLSSAGSPSALGSLTITPDHLDLGHGSTGQLTLTALGGPVTWSATASSSLVTLSSQQGTLRAGQSVTLTVTVTSGGNSGRAFVFVDSASAIASAAAVPATTPSCSQAVQVTWTAAAYQPGRPHPSPSGSSSPSPSPSASPSSL